MKAVRVEIEMCEVSAVVVFIRDTDNQWHADVKLGDGSSWAFTQSPRTFWPSVSHAEHLVLRAFEMVNSGRAA